MLSPESVLGHLDRSLLNRRGYLSLMLEVDSFRRGRHLRARFLELPFCRWMRLGLCAGKYRPGLIVLTHKRRVEDGISTR